MTPEKLVHVRLALESQGKMLDYELAAQSLGRKPPPQLCWPCGWSASSVCAVHIFLLVGGTLFLLGFLKAREAAMWASRHPKEPSGRG